MWTERFPNIGETVKIEFSENTNMGIRIGVVSRFFENYVIVDFGKNFEYLDRITTFFVLQKHEIIKGN